MVDDVRIYDIELTQEGILKIMACAPTFASSPTPENGSAPDIEHATPLTWEPGEITEQHDVYFGIDSIAVETPF